MIPRSRLAALAALLLAGAGHAAFALLQENPSVEMAGGQTALAAAGSSFMGMAEGVQAPVAAEPVEQPPVEPLQERPQAAAALPVQTPQPVPPEAPVQAALAAPVPLKSPAAQSEAPAVGQQVRPEPAARPQQAETAAAKRPEPAAAASPPPPEVQKPEPEVLQPAPKPRPEPAKPQGNSQTNATRGTVQGSAKAPGGEAASKPGNAKVQGNAAADNYLGQVLRRVQRAKRKSSSLRGAAVVAFSIDGNGALAAASIARSSGSAKFDKIALAQVRRAAPFPPPPPGAKTRFSVTIKGR